MPKTHLCDELKALIYRFENFLYCHCSIGKTTAGLYVGTIRRAYLAIGAVPTIETAEVYMADMRRAGASNNYASAMCTAFERFFQMQGTPIDFCRPPCLKHTVPITMSEAEIAIFLHACKNLRERAILSLLAYSGIRNKELCNVRIRDVDLGNGIIRVEVGKFNKQRIVGITGECVAVLVEYLKERAPATGDDLLFITARHGYEMEQQDIRKIVRVVAKRAGINRRIWPHLLRHSLATNMIDRGAHLLTVRDQLGHVYVDSTMVYVHRSKKTHSNDYRRYAPSYL